MIDNHDDQSTALQKYKDAINFIDQAALESKKCSQVDITLMCSNIACCAETMQELHAEEQDVEFKAAISQLLDTLAHQQEILQTKIRQMKANPVTPSHESSAKFQFGSNTNVEDKQCETRRLAIEDTIVVKGKVKFADVAGLLEAKQTLNEAIIMPLQFPQLFTGARKPWKRILLYGPPGTGKTRLAQAVSGEINSTFYSVCSSDLISSWVGESEKLIRHLFHHAVNRDGRSVVFIDEIDSLCRKRSSREEEHTRRVKTELLKQMDGADNSEKNEQVFLLCATNCPWELDSAFLRRFQKRIYIPLPGAETREKVLKIHSRDNQVDLTEDEWRELAMKTEGFSGSDLSTVVLGALFEPIREMQTATHWRLTADNKLTPCAEGEFTDSFHANITDLPPEKVQLRGVQMKDFLRALASCRQTVTQTELEHFKEFTNKYGLIG